MVYPVSAAYRAAMRNPVQKFAVSGDVDGVQFTEADLLGLEYSNQCSDGTSLRIGQVYIGELRATFTRAFAELVSRGSWAGAVITVTSKMDVAGMNASAPVWESVPVGVFTVRRDGVSWTETGLELTAYDNMSKLDRAAYSTSRGGKPYAIANSRHTAYGYELGQTEAEIDALPNGTNKFYWSNASNKTMRDVFAWLGEVTGTFVTAGRDGKIYFRPYGRDVVDTLDPAHRWTGGRFGDYETRYSHVYVKNSASGVTYHADLGEFDDFLRYDLGENPLLQIDSEAATRFRLYPILHALQGIRYTPFECSAIGNPAYDLGDVIRFTGGVGDETRLYCITSFTWTLNQGWRMSGSGENPDVWSVKGRDASNIETAQGNAEAASVEKNKPLHFSNASSVSVADGAEETVLEAEFAVSAATVVEARAEILLTATASGDAAATVRYSLNGTTQTDRQPVQTLRAGNHILALLYVFTAPRGYVNDFSVSLEMADGSASIAAGGALLSLTGIGVGEEPEEYPEDPAGTVYIAVDSLPDVTAYYLDYGEEAAG